jgi:hypothetical protein
VETETFESFIEILSFLKSWGFSMNDDLFPLGSALFELDHSKFSDFSFDTGGEGESERSNFLISFLQEFVEDNFVHSSAVVIADFHEQSSALHILQLLGLG